MFKFIFMVSTFAMEIDISHILEANTHLLAAPVVTTHLPDIRSIKKKKKSRLLLPS